jgi:flagellar L-ring protein FlgH
MRILPFVSFIALGAMLTGCTTVDRLASVGEAPPLTQIQNPTAVAGYQPVSMPMPAPVNDVYEANSLYRQSSRGFFRDQRAQRVGDIVTVLVTIDDQAEISNRTNRNRSSTNEAGVGGAFGSILNTVAPNIDASSAIDVSSGVTDTGAGGVNRAESIETRVAAVVTQILPNGNLVIEGRQEVRVNFEVRDLVVAGVVRPEDIEADNTIQSEKIAEARISYGGRGQITDVQQPRYGQQVLDAILPF